MIGAAQAWKVLGIKPTSDRRAVKRAYAVQLKAIDPDSDIAGFQRLREALDVAERTAKALAAREAGGSTVGGPDQSPIAQGGSVLTAPVLEIRKTTPEASSAPQANRESSEGPKPGSVSSVPAPSPAPVLDPIAGQRRQLGNLLRRRDQDVRSQDELIALLEAILADERMEQVGFAEEFEEWLADQLLRSIPGSDPVIPLAIARFGWLKELKAARPRYAPALIARRGEDLRCIAALNEPEHEWHTVFVRLQEPAPTSIDYKDRMRLAGKTRDLLNSLRWHNPDVETMLDAQHVEMWRGVHAQSSLSQTDLFEADKVSWYGWLMIAFVAVNILRILAGLF